VTVTANPDATTVQQKPLSISGKLRWGRWGFLPNVREFSSLQNWLAARNPALSGF
jgi:hypothetical protein